MQGMHTMTGSKSPWEKMDEEPTVEKADKYSEWGGIEIRGFLAKSKMS